MNRWYHIALVTLLLLLLLLMGKGPVYAQNNALPVLTRELSLQPTTSGTLTTLTNKSTGGGLIINTLPTTTNLNDEKVLLINGSNEVTQITLTNLFGGTVWRLDGNAATDPLTDFLGTTDAQPLIIKTNNTERMRVLSGGNTGIGTTTPAAQLHVLAANKEGIGAIIQASSILPSVSGPPLGPMVPPGGGNANLLEFRSPANDILSYVTWAGALVFNPYGTASGETNELLFKELASNGTNYIGFKAADAISTDVVWTLPSADGSANQALTTNGSSVLGWSTVLTPTTGWSTTGNSGTDSTINFLGTTDARPLVVKIAGTERMRIDGGGVLSTNKDLVANGVRVGSGGGGISTNTTVGLNTLQQNTTGELNTALGTEALYSNTIGNSNTGTGRGALRSNVDGNNNTAVGSLALYYNTSGSQNTAVGRWALHQNTTASFNIAIGTHSMYSNTTGQLNTGLGFEALYSSVTGSSNVAIGYQAGKNETGSNKLYIANSDANNLIYGDFSSGLVSINAGATPAVPGASLQVNAFNASTKGVIVKGAASATANLVEVQNSAGAALVSVDPSGATTIGGTLTLSSVASANTADEVLLINSSNQVTKTTRANLFAGSGWALTGNDIATSSGALGVAPSGSWIGTKSTSTAKDLRIATNGVTRMIIASDGAITMGGTLGVTGATNINTIGSGVTNIGTSSSTGAVSIGNTGNATTLGSIATTLKTSVGSNDRIVLANSSGTLDQASISSVVAAGIFPHRYVGSLITIGDQANGSSALYNAALGVDALDALTTGTENTAVGYGALTSNTTGSENTAIGNESMRFNSTGNKNTAVGDWTLADLTTGSYNIALGYNAGLGAAWATDNYRLYIGAVETETFIYGNMETRRLIINRGPNSTDGLTTANGPALQVNTYYSANKGLVVRGAASQSQNLLELQTSAGAALFTASSTGALTLNPYGTSAGNTNELLFKELASNGTNYIGFKAADAISTDVVWTLPSADGSANQALTTNGTSVLGWSTVLTPTTGWSTTGNSGTNPTNNFIGTTDSQDFVVKTANSERVRMKSTGQVGIGTDNPAALLDVAGTFRSSGTVTLTSVATGAAADDVLLINSSNQVTKTTRAELVAGSGWALTGNTGTDPVSHFVGTTDAKDLVFRTNNTERVRIQNSTGRLTTQADAQINGLLVGRGGSSVATNVAIGGLGANTTGSNNIAIGDRALSKNTSGANNIVLGVDAARDNLTGSENVVIGQTAMLTNTGSENIAIGHIAGRYSASGEMSIANNSVFLGRNTRAADNNQTNQIVIGHNTIGLGSNTVVLGNGSIITTALRGNVLINNSGSSAGQVRFLEGSAGADYVAIQSPASLAAPYTLTLPTDDGDANQVLTTNGSGVMSWSTINGLQYFTEVLHTASPNNTVNAVQWKPATGTNVDVVISPRGTGALMARVPDGTSLDGNKRGAFAVDWQLLRGDPEQVASGTFSTISGGQSNQASGDYSVVSGGRDNQATGIQSTVSGGIENWATGEGSSVLGGIVNKAQGAYSTVLGGQYLTLLGGNSAGYNGSGDPLTVANSNTFVLGNVNLWFANNDNTARELRFYEAQSTTGAFPAAGTNYTAFKAGAQSADVTYTLPTAAPTTNGQVLSSTTGGTMSWVDGLTATTGWSTTGNSGLNASTNFLGTIDSVDVTFRHFNTERMRLTKNGLRVSQGTGTPRASQWAASFQNIGSPVYLELLNSDAATNGGGMYMGMRGTGSVGDSATIWNWQGGPLVFYTHPNNRAGTVRMLIDSDGDVGIGSHIPTQRLHVRGGNLLIDTVGTGGSTPGQLQLRNPQGTAQTNIQAGFQTTDITYTLPTAGPTVNGQVLSANTTGVMSWTSGLTTSTGWTTTGNSGTSAATNFIGTLDAEDLVLKRNNEERARITNTGMRVIQSGTPRSSAWALSVQNISTSGVSNAYIELLNSTAAVDGGGGFLGLIGSGAVGDTMSMWNWQAGPIKFKTSTTNKSAFTRMTIHPSGNVGIGTDITAPGTLLDVDGGLTLRPGSNIVVSADNQAVTIGNRSHVVLESNGTPVNRTITISNGLQTGQILFLMVTGTAAANGIELADDPTGSNTNLSGLAQLVDGAVLQLIWNGNDWMEVTRSNN